jgi:hypothetical protein
MTITIQSVTVSYDELVEQGKALENALTAAQNAANALSAMTTERNAAAGALEASNAAYEAERAAHLKTQRGLAESIEREKTLQARIVELTKPPVVIPPVTPQKVTRQALGRWAGFTLEHGKSAPSHTQNAYARLAMDWGKSVGLDMVRLFINPSEARLMSTMTDDNPENIIGYARKIGLRWMADTMDTIASLLKTPTELKAYCDALAKMGCEGFYVNDADRMAIPFEALRLMIARFRAAAPEMPIFVSLLGSANVDQFKTVADYVEIQTFGSLAELSTFLKRGVIPCLDLRKPMTVTDLKARAEVALRFPPQAFYFYADLVTDYQDMPDDEDATVQGIVAAWKRLGA